MLLVRDELRHAVSSGDHAITLGVFDGVHRGHQMLIERARAEAKARGLGTGVVTFHPSPVTVLRPGTPFAYLTTLEQRVELLKATGVDWVAVVQFTSELSQVSAEDFARVLVEEARVRLIVVGEDFAVGRGREGTVTRLQEIGKGLGFEVIPVPLLKRESEDAISSTRVRRALAEGDMAEVTRMLGRPYSIRGPVLHGDERGRAIGFPTLNIGVSADRALPPNGVYVTRAEVQGRMCHGTTNIGVQPTFEGTTRRVETHLLDFDGNIYGQVVTIDLLERLREERKFEGVEALVAQITRDVAATRSYFA
ncbi:MAG: bifunctional riboflavin kinase/FAD synthetase [Dehalococcoidia bacterium]